jgi:pyridoxamine 5'-phosphate oxidase family protein
MTFTSAELAYLGTQPLGRLATTGPDGPQNKPVGFSFNAELGTIDIHGYNLEQSQKFRNIQANPRVAFLVDDAPGQDAAGMRFLEIRGTAEAISEQGSTASTGDRVIRIRPRRIVSWNVDPAQPGLTTRDVTA